MKSNVHTSFGLDRINACYKDILNCKIGFGCLIEALLAEFVVIGNCVHKLLEHVLPIVHWIWKNATIWVLCQTIENTKQNSIWLNAKNGGFWAALSKQAWQFLVSHLCNFLLTWILHQFSFHFDCAFVSISYLCALPFLIHFWFRQKQSFPSHSCFQFAALHFSRVAYVTNGQQMCSTQGSNKMHILESTRTISWIAVWHRFSILWALIN